MVFVYFLCLYFYKFYDKKNIKMCEVLDINFDILVYMKKFLYFYVKIKYIVYFLEV